MSFFVVDKEYHVVLDVSSVRHSSPTNYYVTATTEQVEQFYKLSENLPADHYLELHEVLKTQAPTPTKPNHKSANPEFRKAIADMFKSKPTKEKK